MSSFCQNCGRKAFDAHTFCETCGVRLLHPVPTQNFGIYANNSAFNQNKSRSNVFFIFAFIGAIFGVIVSFALAIIIPSIKIKNAFYSNRPGILGPHINMPGEADPYSVNNSQIIPNFNFPLFFLGIAVTIAVSVALIILGYRAKKKTQI